MHGTESRRHPRYQYPAPQCAGVRTSPLDTPSHHKAVINDISLGGVSLITSARLRPQQIVELSIDVLPPITGKVVRTCNGIAGIKFDSIPGDLEPTIETLHLSA